MNHTPEEFQAALEKYLAGVQAIVEANERRVHEAITKDLHSPVPFELRSKISTMPGPKFIRVVQSDRSSRSVYSFVERATGDVFKPASWKAPAKHRRANIFSDRDGLENHTPYGPAYLR